MSANVWDHVLAKVEAKINRHSFYTWFKPTSFIADDGHALTIRVPNPLFKDWLNKHYAVVLSEALKETGRPDAVLTFLASGAEKVETAPEAADESPADDVVPTTAQGLNPRYTFDTFIVGPSPRRRRSPTTRSSFTVASVSARRT
jgi:chromosomal replication initiator protein